MILQVVHYCRKKYVNNYASFIEGNSNFHIIQFLQTLKFVRELGKFTGLTSAAILGGESIEQQFSVMSGSAPDIVVATPGRFLHICVEMNLRLDNISKFYFIFLVID